MIKERIKKLTEKSIKDLQGEKVFPIFKIPKFKVSCTEEKVHGDYSTNAAMTLAREAKKSPKEIADLLIGKIKAKNTKIFEKIEVAGSGFINFFISQEYLQKQVKEILEKKEKFGRLKIGKNKKTNIEFVSNNPTGQLHIGNGWGAFFGDCLANVLLAAGYKVDREYYINDSRNSNQIQELGKTALGKGKSYLTPYLKNLILRLKSPLKKIKSESDAGYFLAQNIVGDVRNFIQEKAKIKFNYWTSEHILFRKNKIRKIYELLKNKKLIYEKENAFWINLSRFGQKDEVLVRNNGQPTYFLSDIAYHKDKMERGYKKIIDIWGADHQGHIPRMKAVMEILGYKGEFDVLFTQIVRLKGGKISKRKGKIITLEWLIDEAGLDAARFFYLMKSLDTQMEFDVKLAKEKSEKSPVYYIQYAHARICSILRKSKIQNSKPKITIKNLKLLIHPSEIALIKQLIKFPEIIGDTAKDYQVQRISHYATELATVFNQFYRDCQVISGDKELFEARLSLSLAAKTVLENTLGLMGISAPEEM